MTDRRNLNVAFTFLILHIQTAFELLSWVKFVSAQLYFCVCFVRIIDVFFHVF